MDTFKKNMLLLFILILAMTTGAPRHLFAQNGGTLKWLRVGELHNFFSEQGAEVEQPRLPAGAPGNDGFFWPAEYGYEQINFDSRGLWLSADNYYDPGLQKTFDHKVVGVGPRSDLDRPNQIMESVLKLVGRFQHPIVLVDNSSATDNDLYDQLDEIDENLKADRMIVNIVNSAIGITVTRKIMAFTQSNHDNYFIFDYVFKNTGIVDRQGTERPVKLNNCWFFIQYRYSFAGESVSGYNQGWGQWNSTWGRNVINHVVGTDPNAPDFKYRAHYAWYGAHSQQPVDDWGCPDYNETGILAAPRFNGAVVLHVDKSPTDQTDDITQPGTTYYIGADDVGNFNYSQYDATIMTGKWESMTRGHAPKSHAQELGYVNSAMDITAFADTWGSDAGGYESTQGFGPYTLEVGDSIHIVIGEGVAGITRQKNREVGGNWFAYYKGTGTPLLKMPDGSSTSDVNAYKKAWVLSGEDSIKQTFDHIISNYNSGFDIPLPPPPPKLFEVRSGGDRIRLLWDNNADSYPNFDGYVIYRSQGNVMRPETVYEKLFECNVSNVVHSHDDTTARRGYDYYYYIQSKDDGSTNDINPGTPMYSSKFYTMTNKAARLTRKPGTELEAIRVVPNPYYANARIYQFGDPNPNYPAAEPRRLDNDHDRLAFYELPPFCKIKVFSERGDLIWEKNHDNGSGDETWNLRTEFEQIIVSGVYIAYFEVTQDYPDSKTGELLFTKGQSTYRKFLVIR